jgi:branched-chain amino acid transport system substrate-binding protein
MGLPMNRDTRARALSRRSALKAGLAAVATGPFAKTALATNAPLRIGILTDMSGFARSVSGPGSVLAAHMAVKAFGPTVAGRPIEILVGDHQHKPDVGSAIARRWFDQEGVTAIADVPNSSIGIAVHQIARQKNRVALLTGTFSSAITNEMCSPNTLQFSLDTYAMGNAAAAAVMAEAGPGASWFFITADFAFGHALEADAATAIRKAGGKIAGTVRHPINNSDFASVLLQAQSSNADVIAIANAAGDTINCIKQASEFSIMQSKQRLVSLLLFITDIDSLGLAVAQNIYCTTGVYWDRDEHTRKWCKEYFTQVSAMPTDAQAGTYSAVLHYLRAISACESDQADIVVTKMKETAVNDAFNRNVAIRADGRVLQDLALAKVKSPDQSTKPWDYLSIKRTIRGMDAYRPLAESKCPLVAVR